MPNQTTSKRISISLNPELHSVISDLAELQNKPMSRVVVELLEEMHPVLANVRDALSEVKKSNDPAAVARRFGQNSLIDASEQLGELSKEIKKL